MRTPFHSRIQFPRVAVRSVAAVALMAATSLACASDLWVYGSRDFAGSYIRISRSEPNVPSFMERSVRSIKVKSGVWDACSGANYTGDCRRLTVGEYNDFGSTPSERVLSVREVSAAAPTKTVVAPVAATGRIVQAHSTIQTVTVGATNETPYNGPSIQMFDRRDFRGRAATLEKNAERLERTEVHFNPRSAIVLAGTWEMCTDAGYAGQCLTLAPGRYEDLDTEQRHIRSARILTTQAPVVTPAAAPVVVPATPEPQQHAHMRGQVEVFTRPEFGGRSVIFDESVAALGGSDLNDRIRSVRVLSGNWELCEHADYTGSCMTFGPGEYRHLPAQLDRTISSMRRMRNDPSWAGMNNGGQNFAVLDPRAPTTRHPIWLFEHADFSGRTLRAFGEVNDFRLASFNDVTSSVFISHGTWQLCEHANFAGRCIVLKPGQYPDLGAYGMNDAVSSIRRIPD